MITASQVAEVELHEPAQEDEPAIFDLAHLRRYTLDDLPLQREILELFRVQVLDSVAKLRASCDDRSAWAMAAHTLKGSARCVGAFRLGRAAERAERNSETAEARARSAGRVAEAAVVTLAHLG